MRYIFKFPDIGEGITEGTILKWYVEKGKKISVGDPVVQMETDKVVADIPSPRDGTIAARYGKVGDVINVSDPLVEIEIEGVEAEQAQEIARQVPRPASDRPIEEKGFGVVGTIEVAGEAAYLPASDEGRVLTSDEAEKTVRRKAFATPVARAMANDLGVDINSVKGTGPGGRVTKNDIRNHYDQIRTGEKTVPVTEPVKHEESPRIVYEPLSQIRKTIARNMITSKQNAAHLTIFDEVEISELVRFRNLHKDRFEAKGIRLTYMPFILKATAAALKNNSALNSEMDLQNNRMIYKNYYNISIAIDTPRGLVVPVIKDVDKLSIFDLAIKIQELAKKAKESKLTLEDMKDGTFSITNYGALGGKYGTPIINYPQAAILGIGRIMETPVVKNGQVAAGTVLPLSLSADHRIVDGAGATKFLLEVMEYLHDPLTLLLI